MIEKGPRYLGIVRVQVLADVAAVNDALAEGWKILRIPDSSTQTHEPGGRTYVVSRPCFVLGWVSSMPDEGPDLEARLSVLPWKLAASGKCDYVRDAPVKLIEAVRAQKGGVRRSEYHYTVSNEEPTLFRFKRGTKQ